MIRGPCLILLVAVTWGCDPGPQTLRLAVTTSTQDSGLIDLLVPMFERARGGRVDVVAVGTGKALRLGMNGDVDVVLVHAREAEDAFMAAGHGIRREDVMYNMFQIVGPTSDPAEVHGGSVVTALREIALGRYGCVSRGDDSGTHKREQFLWQRAGIEPQWPGYVQTGQGMGSTLIIANQMEAYTLTDRGTFLAFLDKVELVPHISIGEDLRNPYGVMIVNPDKNKRIAHGLADRFVDFLISREAQIAIHDFRLNGEPLFYPLHHPESD